jgi:hypothetical protein
MFISMAVVLLYNIMTPNEMQKLMEQKEITEVCL